MRNKFDTIESHHVFTCDMCHTSNVLDGLFVRVTELWFS